MLWKPSAVCLMLALACSAGEYERRVETVRRTPGFVALWDFVLRDGDRFNAHQPRGSRADLRLDPLNYVREYWGAGRAAAAADFPLLGRGPFGDGIRIRSESEPDFRPLLLVPRARLHNTGLDVKGPRRSVSMVVWLVRESGNHAVAGIWHEGTDLQEGAARRVERGMRQYALFAGLAANQGAAAVHVSENGTRSFGDRYARNLAATPQVMPPAAGDDPPDEAWQAAGFVFDNARDTVTAYLNGKAEDFWIDAPQKHPFFQWPAKGWEAAERARRGSPDPAFPADQYYRPPERKPLERAVLERSSAGRVELHRYAFTKVRVALDSRGRVLTRELVALRANPFWFSHDLYSPATPAEGGPFTIGRVIHSSRSVGFTGWIGAVAVFNRPLSPAQMAALSALCRPPLRR